jgi:hypothetical protein
VLLILVIQELIHIFKINLFKHKMGMKNTCLGVTKLTVPGTKKGNKEGRDRGKGRQTGPTLKPTATTQLHLGKQREELGIGFLF